MKSNLLQISMQLERIRVLRWRRAVGSRDAFPCQPIIRDHFDRQLEVHCGNKVLNRSEISYNFPSNSSPSDAWVHEFMRYFVAAREQKTFGNAMLLLFCTLH